MASDATTFFADPDAATLRAARLEQLFASPVMCLDWPDSEPLNLALCEVVRRRREQSVGVVKTNRGGWQSQADLQDWDDAEAREVLRRIRLLACEYVQRLDAMADDDLAGSWEIRAWANVNEHGHFNRSHDHLGARSFISGVYYVDVGDIERGQVSGGRTRFEDWSHVPIRARRNSVGRDHYVDPRNGRMVLFPASLQHSVEPYQGHAQRITLAFNLYHPALEVPRLGSYLQQADWWWINFRGFVLLRRKLPEKLSALASLPAHWWRSPPGGSMAGRLGMAWARASAAAAERFEASAASAASDRDVP